MNALSTQADGSAIVRQGATTVVCGVRAELAPPRPEEPDRGYLVRQTLNIEIEPRISGEANIEHRILNRGYLVGQIFDSVGSRTPHHRIMHPPYCLIAV